MVLQLSIGSSSQARAAWTATPQMASHKSIFRRNDEANSLLGHCQRLKGSNCPLVEGKVYRKSALLPPTKVKAASFTFLLKPMLGIRHWHHIGISEVPRGPGIFPSNQGVLQLCVHAELWVDPQKSITDSLGITAVAPTWLWVKGTRIDPEI